jgi:hypothetical protein
VHELQSCDMRHVLLVERDYMAELVPWSAMDGIVPLSRRVEMSSRDHREGSSR